MVTVFDVAKYILDKYGAMSAMKLEKLVFYSQAMSMVWDDVPLFENDFQAWAKGPVCPELYHAHKGMFMVKDSGFLSACGANPDNLNSEQKETIDVVVDSLIDYPAYKLSAMTHSEKPWKEARKNCQDGVRCTNVISKSSMADYYEENWA